MSGFGPVKAFDGCFLYIWKGVDTGKTYELKREKMISHLIGPPFEDVTVWVTKKRCGNRPF